MWVLFERGMTGVGSQPIAFAFDIEELKRIVPLEYFRGCLNAYMSPGFQTRTKEECEEFLETPLSWQDGINWNGVSESWLTKEKDFHHARYSYKSYWKIQHLASFQQLDNFYSTMDSGCKDGEYANEHDLEDGWKKLKEVTENWTKAGTIIGDEQMSLNEFNVDENNKPIPMTYYNGEAFKV